MASLPDGFDMEDLKLFQLSVAKTKQLQQGQDLTNEQRANILQEVAALGASKRQARKSADSTAQVAADNQKKETTNRLFNTSAFGGIVSDTAQDPNGGAPVITNDTIPPATSRSQAMNTFSRLTKGSGDQGIFKDIPDQVFDDQNSNLQADKAANAQLEAQKSQLDVQKKAVDIEHQKVDIAVKEDSLNQKKTKRAAMEAERTALAFGNELSQKTGAGELTPDGKGYTGSAASLGVNTPPIKDKVINLDSPAIQNAFKAGRAEGKSDQEILAILKAKAGI